MDERMKKHRQLSPERAKVWTEKSPKYRYNQHYSSPPPPSQHYTRKVPVVYYLCRNRQLEHPHFMEVPLSCNDLYLRDVIERLNVLRGRGIGSLYSWSCKRSYKNGFVWHDLSDDDVIHPAHGNEYILKGSELFEESNPGRFSPAANFILHDQRALPEPHHPRNQASPSSSSSLNGGTTKNSQDDELSPRPHHYRASPESGSSLTLADYNVQKIEGITNASTQTDERGVSCDVGEGLSESHQNKSSEVVENSEGGPPAPGPPTPGPAISSSRTDTLESLIRADLRKLNSFRLLEEGEGLRMPSNTKIKVVNMIMQLISCGSIQEKDQAFGFITNYRPRLSNSLTMGELDLRDNRRVAGKKSIDKKCFSGSLVEKNVLEGDATTLKRSSSYNADRNTNQIGESSRISEPDTSNGSKRMEEAENVIKIEESRLASGARVIIQSKAWD